MEGHIEPNRSSSPRIKAEGVKKGSPQNADISVELMTSVIVEILSG